MVYCSLLQNKEELCLFCTIKTVTSLYSNILEHGSHFQWVPFLVVVPAQLLVYCAEDAILNIYADCYQT